jgi:hypothetical protein
MFGMTLTATDVCRLLRRAEYPMTERNLVAWRTQGHLPAMKRVPRPAGGRGAHYVWPDADILAHIATLMEACNVRYRMETADVLAWFAGFDYPIGFIRDKWASFEELGLEAWVRRASAGELLSFEDAVQVILVEARAEASRNPKTRRFSQTFVDALTRADVDPTFDAGIYLTARRATEIRKDLLGLVGINLPSNAEADDFMAVATPERVRAGFIAVQDYWFAPRFGRLVQELPEGLLAEAHADCRTILMPYREWLTDRILHGHGRPSGLELAAVVPMAVARLGRVLLKLDIFLRRNGLGADVDATVSAIRALFEDPWVRATFREFWREYWQVVSTDYDQDGFLDSIETRKDTEPRYADYFRLRERGFGTAKSVAERWWPHLRTLLDQVAASTEAPV